MRTRLAGPVLSILGVVVTVVTLVISPGAASAEDMSYHPPKHYTGTPQHFAFEVKLGPYSPNIDSSPGLTGTPFSDLFNDQYGDNVGQRPPGRVLTTLEFDWQFLQKFGSLGVGVELGIMRRSTHSFMYGFVNGVDASGGLVSCQVPNCTRSSDTNTLTVVPIDLLVVYRFDVLAKRWHIPIVPYAKIGLAYYMWFIQRGDGDLSKGLDPLPDGGVDKAAGGTPGFVVKPGLALQLDWIDREGQQTMDAEVGVNHTYAFAELNYANVSGLGIWKNKLVLSDLTWQAGIAFEF